MQWLAPIVENDFQRVLITLKGIDGVTLGDCLEVQFVDKPLGSAHGDTVQWRADNSIQRFEMTSHA